MESDSKEEMKSNVLTQNDLRKACRQQILGQLQLTGFNLRVIPNTKLEDLELGKKELKVLNALINKHKSSKVLTGQCGFKGRVSAY